MTTSKRRRRKARAAVVHSALAVTASNLVRQVRDFLNGPMTQLAFQSMGVDVPPGITEGLTDVERALTCQWKDGDVADPPWTEFGAADLIQTEMSKAARDAVGDHPTAVYRNNLFTAEVRKILPTEEVPAAAPQYILHLSFKRNDRQPIGDWRVKQRIKNLLLGEDIDAVEVFPAETRLVDTSNQYHLWGLPPGHEWPCGFSQRFVMEDPGMGAVQRPWADDDRPSDLTTREQADADLARIIADASAE